MEVLAAGLILAAVVAGLNLLLTVGVIRRLREHTTRLAAIASSGMPLSGEPAVGDPIGGFTAVTADGQEVSSSQLPASYVAAFLSPGCEPCERLLPDLVSWLQDANDPGSTLVVVAGSAEDSRPYQQAVRGLALVVTEEPVGPVMEAFGVRAFPTVLTVTDWVVAEVGNPLPSPVRSRLVYASQPVGG